MKQYLALVLLVSFLGAPVSALGASAKPAVSIVAPAKGATMSRAAIMPITVSLKNVTRPMVLVTSMELIRKDISGPSVGYVSDSGFQHTLTPGQQSYSFTQDWGANDTIPGTYTVYAELRECNKDGCQWEPGKRLAKSKKVKITLTRGTSSSGESRTGTTVRISSPNGGEEYDAGKGSLTIKWEASGVPKGAQICTSLERRGGGVFVFPAGTFCKSVKDGKGSVKGKLLRTGGYDLAPGTYWARISIGGKASGGKDGPNYALDVSDDSFTLE